MPKITKRIVDGTTAREDKPKLDGFVWDSDVHGFGLRVKPSGAKAFIVQYRMPGHRTAKRRVIGKCGVLTVDEARKEARLKLADVQRGHDPFAERDAKRKAPTVAELCTSYIERHAEPYKKPRSVVEDERNIELHVKPALGKKLVAEITRADIARLHHKMKDHPTGANRVLSLLSKMFSLAEDWEMRPDYSNPCRRVKRYKETARERYLTPPELARLGEVLADTERDQVEPASVIAAIRLLLFTGARKGEITSLRWRDVDMRAGTARLPDSKTGAKTIYLSAPALAVLADLERGDDDDAYVLTGRTPGKGLGSLDQAWQRIRERADIPDVRIHDLRHSFGSIAAGLGEGLPTIGRMLGHTVASTTQRYAHVAPDAAQIAADRVAGAIHGMMTGKSADVVDMRNRK